MFRKMEQMLDAILSKVESNIDLKTAKHDTTYTRGRFFVINDHEFNDFAFEINFLRMQLLVSRNKIEQVSKKLKQIRMRINLYINEYADGYDVLKHSILFNDNGIEIYKVSDINKASQKGKTEYYGEAMSIDDDDNIDSKSLTDIIKKYLPEPEYKISMSKDQKKFLNRLVAQYGNYISEMDYAKEMNSGQFSEYVQLISECVEGILDNPKLYFNDSNGLYVCFNDKKSLWQLVIGEKNDNMNKYFKEYFQIV